MGPISPVMPPLRPGGIPVRPGFPFPPFPGFPGGGFFPYWYGYGYGYQQPPTVVVVPTPTGPAAPPERVVIPGNEFPAVLVLEFPAVAEVWINGEKGDAKPDREWTLTSPVLKPGEEFTFKVKARWKSGNKTYEAERSVTVPGGKRSRVLVVGGTEIKE
jgi:uncharacterized protein (TIGR03000 family)